MRYIEADGHLGPLCDMRSRLDYPGMTPIVAETLEANARLVVAAPDLLRALEMMLEAFNPGNGDLYAVQKAQEAIAKAKGDTP